MGKPELRIFRDADAVAHAAAALFVEAFKAGVARSGQFSVVLSGGQTPLKTYELLVHAPYASEINWKQVHVFWGDERCVPITDDRSNYRAANDIFLSRVPLPRAQIHPILCAQSPDRSATDYETLLKTYFAQDLPMFDLVFLGLGDDGHTASLFPESDTLFEKTKWVVATHHGTESFGRMSLTAGILSRTRLALFLVTGDKKSEIIKKVLQRPNGDAATTSSFPAQHICPAGGRLLWLTDSLKSADPSET